MLCDQIVFGVEDRKVRERLLRETELMMEEALKTSQASELSQMHVRTFSTAAVSDDATVGAVSSQGVRHTQTQPAQRLDIRIFTCKCCGSQHKPKQCPAFGKQCCNFQGKHHFAKQCSSKRKGGKKGNSVNTLEDTDLKTFFVGMVN